MYVYIIYKFFKKCNFLSSASIVLRNKKKNLFFKKRFLSKFLISKRLSFVFKKKKLKNQMKRTTGNFFFKKFFYKTLLSSRKNLKFFFFNTKKIRQKNLNKYINTNTNKRYCNNTTTEYSLLNIILKGHLFLFNKDAAVYIKKGFVCINGQVQLKSNFLVVVGDCIQLIFSKSFFNFFNFFKKFIKNKVMLYKQNSWKFFKKIFLHKNTNTPKNNKRKNPNYLFFLFLYKLNTPKYVEVDFMTMSIVLLRKCELYKQSTFFLNKTFSFKLFSLYNFKKFN